MAAVAPALRALYPAWVMLSCWASEPLRVALRGPLLGRAGHFAPDGSGYWYSSLPGTGLGSLRFSAATAGAASSTPDTQRLTCCQSPNVNNGGACRHPLRKGTGAWICYFGLAHRQKDWHVAQILVLRGVVMRWGFLFGCSAVVLTAAACSSSTTTQNIIQASGGSTASGGASRTSSSTTIGGASSGTSGSTAIGGATHTGGSPTVSGSSSTGGTSSAGGMTTAGGTSSTSGVLATGGTTASGGMSSGTGGTAPTGSATATGGTTASSTGGTNTILNGGSAPVASGGTRATGGSASVTATGGAATGGAPPNIGGAATGGAATGGSSATGGAAGSGCTGSFETVQSSTGLCVAKMVPITAPSASNNYSIDATEVTKGQYDMWLATSPALPASTDANCGYVTSYAEQGTSGIYTGTDAAHHPVVYVDWCDAYMYCKGVGKRLCGAIGGGTNAMASSGDATLSQWYRACSSGGADTYPYGNTYQATYCNGADYWNDNTSAEQTVAVGSLANCVTSATGFAGAYDLSGNVWEWEDSCNNTAQTPTCVYRGSSFSSSGSMGGLTCGEDMGEPRDTVSNLLGFRCCSP